MATTVQRADTNGSSGKKYVNPFLEDPYYNLYLTSTKFLNPGEKAQSTTPSWVKPSTNIHENSNITNSYLLGAPFREGYTVKDLLDSVNGRLSVLDRLKAIGTTPTFTSTLKKPDTKPDTKPNTDPYIGSGGSGGGFTDIAPGVSVKGSPSVVWGSGGSAGGTGTLPGGASPAVQPSGMDAVQEKLRAATDLANQDALNTYNSGKSELNANIENQLRELYIARMMADKALPVQMAAQGINGGAAESTLAGNRNQYQTNRNTLYQDANAKLADLLKTYNTSVNNNEQNLAQQMADLRMKLAIMEAQAKYDKELARMRK
nr:MAG TPA: hypothetical protein [Caudoviricetes sp.]